MPQLACPRCESTLQKQADGKLVCAACEVSFPLLGQTPWAVPLMWPAPGNTLVDWRNRFNAALAEIESQIAACASPAANLADTSQQRITRLHEGYTRYHQEVSALLEPLRVGEVLAPETHLALKTRLPSHHGVLSYAQNIHRDWCWGDAENQQVCDHLLSALNATEAGSAVDSTLVLGCGAGRLAYDLHRHLPGKETWALDSNPLLCCIGSQLCHGQELTLTEFPLAPTDLDAVAISRTLTAPQATDGLYFVCADARSPPFAAESFDLVVTPWLLDVVDAGVADVLAVIARLLKPGGTWLQHGSVAFSGDRPEHRLTATELAELTQMCGFTVQHKEDVLMPYMQSPASRQQRQELKFF